jgi:hypothetical protein
MATSERERHKKKKIRVVLCNIPDINACINKRMAKLIGNVSRSSKNTYPRKILGA